MNNNKAAKNNFLKHYKGGHYEYSENHVDGWDKDGNHLCSYRKTGAGIWGPNPDFVAEGKFDESVLHHVEKHEAIEDRKK